MSREGAPTARLRRTTGAFISPRFCKLVNSSANLQCTIYRDVSLRFTSRALAKNLVEYLSSLVD